MRTAAVAARTPAATGTRRVPVRTVAVAVHTAAVAGRTAAVVAVRTDTPVHTAAHMPVSFNRLSSEG